VIDALVMNRLTTVLSSLRERQKKALALFLTAGYPVSDATPGLVLSLAGAGADIIEIGMPFSDPLADGPVIQQSSAIAIQNGVTIAGILDGIRKIRQSSTVPLVLMGYINPILSYGPDRFFRDAASSGVDGVILPELTLEESVRFKSEISSNGICQILLVAPTTPADRITAIDAASSGFLYCVSTTGVTGSAGKGTPDDFLARVKTCAKVNPVLVGFGISTAGEARHAALLSDGVIIGSALIRRLSEGEPLASITGWVSSIREALSAP
jgi:tryptophan synthase alpha chain